MTINQRTLPTRENRMLVFAERLPGRRRGWLPLFVLALLAAVLNSAAAQGVDQSAKLVLRPGDHISIIGNTLADRMQHDGWLETLLQQRFPHHQLVFRNLGFSGDELTLRLRSADFGSPDQWLAR